MSIVRAHSWEDTRAGVRLFVGGSGWAIGPSKSLIRNGYEIWFYTNVAEPTPPQGAKLV